MAVSANRLELLQIADAVAREKSIDRSIVIESMEDALQKAARSRYGQETEVRAEINPKTGEVRFSRLLLVSDDVENDATQILLSDARKRNPAAQVGDWIAETLPPFDFGRVAAQSAKQVIVQKVREAERDRQYDEYKDRIADIVSGIVKRVEYGNVIVDLGRGEAIIRRDEMIPREMFRPGDRVRAYVYDVRREQRGPQIFLSRTHPQFMAKLFRQEVPEIYDGIIEVKSVARDPGSRAKIGVISRDSSIDPVGACVGMRGSRVQAVVNELQGEKIDIIPWSADAATFIVNALQPAEVVKVVLDEDSARIEVVVPDEQLSLAIGRRGQNVRLASQLTGWDIDIMTEAEESERRQKEFVERTDAFMAALDVDEVVGQLLASEGFRSVEELAFVEPAELAGIEGFDEDTATEIQNRAREHIARIEAEYDAKRRELGVADEMKEIEGLTGATLVQLGENDVKTVEDLAGCATDDLVGWTEKKDAETVKYPGFLDGSDISREEAEAIIMAARKKAGWVEDVPEAEKADDAPAAAPEDEGDGPQRTCAVTRETCDRADLIRFVRSPDGEAVADIRNRLPGRGVWIKASRDTISVAARRKVFDRGFREPTRVADDLAARVEEHLEQDALGMLAMANKAGALVAGFGKVSDEVAAGSVAVLVHAADAAADGVRKLDGAVRRSGLPVPSVNFFPSDRLGLALGRSNVIHAALKSGAPAEAFLQRCRRLRAFRDGADSTSGQGPGSNVDE